MDAKEHLQKDEIEQLCKMTAITLWKHFGNNAFKLNPEQADRFLLNLSRKIANNCYSLN